MTPTPDLPLLGASKPWRLLEHAIDSVGSVPWPVRIHGPTGSGKSLVARHIHAKSGRSGPFVSCPINALVSGLEMGQLVGHSRGAFSGAVNDQMGAFEAAHAGTLFLDEIGTASGLVQRCLLQLLEERQVTRLGESRPRLVDVRVIVATNADLEGLVENGSFRSDLYYRLGCLRIDMPSLGGRPGDIVKLFYHFLAERAAIARMVPSDLDPHQLDQIVSYGWPGNVRELIHVVEYYIVFGILPEHIKKDEANEWRDRLDTVLSANAGNKSATATELGISRKTLYGELHRREKGEPNTRDVCA